MNRLFLLFPHEEPLSNPQSIGLNLTFPQVYRKTWQLARRAFLGALPHSLDRHIREFNSRRRRRRGQLRLKNKFYFTYEFCVTLKSFSLFSAIKTASKLNAKYSSKSKKEMKKISHRRSRSPDNAKLGHFTLLFYKGRKEI